MRQRREEWKVNREGGVGNTENKQVMCALSYKSLPPQKY